MKLALARNVKRALKIKRAEWWRANGLSLKIARGETRLYHLKTLAREGNCSLTFLLSGGRQEARRELTETEAVGLSIMHAGRDKHDVARAIGIRDYAYLRSTIANGTVKVTTIVKLCREIKVWPWQLFCDSDWIENENPDDEPSEWDQLVELELMGWLDAPKRENETRREAGLVPEARQKDSDGG